MQITINADDYGWNRSCTTAILDAFEKGYIQTTTAIVCGSYFDSAVELIRNTPYNMSIGIHFDLTEGTPITENIKRDAFFCDENGNFHGNIERYKKLSFEQRNLVYGELKAQAEKYQRSNLKFHHADSHHHIHTAPYITPIVIQVMKEYGIEKLRLHRNIGNIRFIKRELKNVYNFQLKLKGLGYSDYFGSFDDLCYFHKKYPNNKVLEIMCHPDFDGSCSLVDRSPDALYELPYGVPMVECYGRLDDGRDTYE